jgi:hypothetical protein
MNARGHDADLILTNNIIMCQQNVNDHDLPVQLNPAAARADRNGRIDQTRSAAMHQF